VVADHDFPLLFGSKDGMACIGCEQCVWHCPHDWDSIIRVHDGLLHLLHITSSLLRFLVSRRR